MILERTRAALRERPRVDLQRKELATSARVTPALISYYYPDRASLFTAAAQPVLEQYIDDVRNILGSDATPLDRLRSLTHFLVGFHFRDGYLLDFCLEQSRKSGNQTVSDQLKDADRDMIGFFDELAGRRLLRGGCAHTLQSTLWGMCKQVAYRLREETTQGEGADVGERAEVIFDCFSNGVSGLLFWAEISTAA